MTGMSTYMVADIGGTNARFAIATGSSSAGYKLEHIARYRNEDFEHLRDAAHAFLESWAGRKPDLACFAVAGPVSTGKVRLTNSTWRFCPKDLAAELGLDRLVPVNDFAAQARGALLVEEADRVLLNPGKSVSGASHVVLGPGTGLGLGILVPRGDDVVVIPTEGGHAGFAPRTEEEIEVGRFIADEYGFVSWERLLSGRGLVNIHRALSVLAGEPWPGRRPEDITSEALKDPSSLSRRATDIFCAVLGAYAGDVAVLSGARGGVHIGGGIAPMIRTLIEEGDFLARFQRRGPMTHYVSAIPVHLILTDNAALLGAAALAEKGSL